MLTLPTSCVPTTSTPERRWVLRVILSLCTCAHNVSGHIHHRRKRSLRLIFISFGFVSYMLFPTVVDRNVGEPAGMMPSDARGRSSDFAVRPTNCLPNGQCLILNFFPSVGDRWFLMHNSISGVVFVAIKDGSQLRDSPGFPPDSLFNHAISEPIASAKVRLSEEKAKFICTFSSVSFFIFGQICFAPTK